jgi:hypothetical protein
MSEPTLKLPGGADQLLQSYPANEPDFEAQAEAIAARIAAADANQGVAFDDLLKAPDLSAEAGEPGAPTPSEVRVASAPKSSFAEMARKSLQKKDDSAELTKELLAATAHRRRPDAEMVERVRAAGRAHLSATSTPEPASPRRSSPDREASSDEAGRPSGVVARALPAAAVASANQRGTMIGIAGVLVGIAACVALFLERGDSQAPASASLPAEKAEPQAPRTAGVPGRPAATAEKPEPGVLSPEALAAAPEAIAAREASKSAPRSATPAAAALAAPADKTGPAPSAVAQQHVVLDEEASPAPRLPLPSPNRSPRLASPSSSPPKATAAKYRSRRPPAP